MDPRTDANRHASTSVSPSHPADGGAVVTEAAHEPADASTQSRDARSSVDRTCEQTRRESVDPMRATDRYRLVHPVTAGI